MFCWLLHTRWHLWFHVTSGFFFPHLIRGSKSRGSCCFCDWYLVNVGYSFICMCKINNMSKKLHIFQKSRLITLMSNSTLFTLMQFVTISSTWIHTMCRNSYIQSYKQGFIISHMPIVYITASFIQFINLTKLNHCVIITLFILTLLTFSDWCFLEAAHVA